MFASNTDWGGDPQSPRGDGKYRPVLARGDGHMMFLMARSLVFDRDVSFDNDLRQFGDPWRQRTTKTGYKDIPHPIGPPLIWAPVLASAHLGAIVANTFGASIPTHGYTMFHQRIVFFTSVLFAFFSVLLGARVARRVYYNKKRGGWSPIYAAIAVLFGTSLTYYATFMPSYAHSMDAFFSACFLATWALSIGEPRWQRYALLGVLLGLSALVRVPNLSFGIVVALEILVSGLRSPTEHRKRLIAQLVIRGGLTLTIALVVFSPQIIAWKLIYGDYLVSPMGPHYVQLSHPFFLETLFASRNGWLSSHPIAYLGCIGLIFFCRKAPMIGLGFVAAVLFQLWINSSVYDWWGSSAFGGRRMCSVTLILVVGLASLAETINVFLVSRVKAPRWARHLLALVILGWFCIWNVAQVRALPRGKAAGHSASPSCCRHAPRFMNLIARPIYRAIGNPFSFPANAWFALRHGVNLKRWDVAVGNYVYTPGNDLLLNGHYRMHRSEFKLNTRGTNRYITGGFAQPQKDPELGSFRWTIAAKASVIVPIRLPEPHVFTLSLTPNTPDQSIVVKLNGTIMVATTLRPGTQTVHFTASMAVLHAGSNVLQLETTLAPPQRALPPPPEADQVGVAVGSLWLTFPKH